jgi:hypothetical protein
LTLRPIRFLSLVALVSASLWPAIAWAQNQAEMLVGATVVPHCRFSTESAGQPAVTASCGASSLRTLRVANSRGERIQPVAGRRLRAGGDATFVVSRTPGVDGRDVVLTLDF